MAALTKNPAAWTGPTAPLLASLVEPALRAFHSSQQPPGPSTESLYPLNHVPLSFIRHLSAPGFID